MNNNTRLSIKTNRYELKILFCKEKNPDNDSLGANSLKDSNLGLVS